KGKQSIEVKGMGALEYQTVLFDVEDPFEVEGKEGVTVKTNYFDKKGSKECFIKDPDGQIVPWEAGLDRVMFNPSGGFRSVQSHYITVEKWSGGPLGIKKCWTEIHYTYREEGVSNFTAANAQEG
ncbi:MAG: hypothetical protein ACTSXG_00890, partial [Alphaproteobacteria bacterium]